MTDSMRDSLEKKLSESGMHEIHQLVDPSAQARYRHLQWIAIASAVSHATAVFLAIYSFRAGDLQALSLVQLMHFVAGNHTVWQLTCALSGLSAISFLILFLAIKQILRVRDTLWLSTATMLIVIAVALDVQSFGNLMVYFGDISSQVVKVSGFKQYLILEGWRSLNQALTQSILLANTFYAVGGLILARAIIAGFGLPKWLGWTSIPVWLVAILASILTFTGQLKIVIVVMFAMVIAFILWTIALAVAVDAYSHTHRIPLDKPAN
ncbi:MAG: hypothetical protein K2X93_24345 [Candidatus Obscuribacterales bacterium]|nr:hypothetical protein [Candidatus Obscuribacterales bacterium]